MNKLEQIVKDLKELVFAKEPIKIELAEVTFSDGRIGRYEGETLEVGMMLNIVTDAGEVPADGDLELESNGSIITAEAGVVKSITEVPEEVEETALTKEEVEKIISDSVKDATTELSKDFAEKFEAQAKEIESLKSINKKQTELNDIFAKTPIVEPTNKPKKSTKQGDFLDKYRHITD